MISPDKKRYQVTLDPQDVIEFRGRAAAYNFGPYFLSAFLSNAITEGLNDLRRLDELTELGLGDSEEAMGILYGMAAIVEEQNSLDMMET